MKKQTISKIAALGLAAMTVVPMFGISASADVVKNDATSGSPAHITGTACKITWETVQTTTVYKATYDSSTGKLVFSQVSEADHTLNASEKIGSGGTAATSGFAYYPKSSIKPKKYTDLETEVTNANETADNDKAGFEKAIGDFNADYDAFENAKAKAYKATTWAEDGTGSTATGGTYTYKNTLGSSITVTFTGDNDKDYKYSDGSNTYSSDENIVDSTKISDYEYTPTGGSATALSDGGTITIVTYKIIPSIDTSVSMSKLAGDLSQWVGITDDEIVEATATQAGDPGVYYVSTGNQTDSNDKNETTVPNDSTTKPGDTTKPGTDVDVSDIPAYASYSTAHPWYSTATKKYYRTYLEGKTAANGAGSVYDATPNSTTSTTIDSSSYYSSTYHWYSAYTGRYYRTYSDALAASNGYSSYVSDSSASISSSAYYSTTYPWYSSLTRRYYRTYSDAVTASGGNSSYVSSGSATTVTTDPYTYYYNLLGTNNASSNKDTSNVTIGKSKGWTAVTKTINSAKSGSTYTVTMNGETTVPTSVMSALRGKNVNINFKLSNGVTYTINGTDIESTSAMDLYTRTGTKNVPTALKKKVVSANKGVSTSQLTISDSLNGSATLSVKFNTARAGRSAKLYRYNPASNSLALVSTATVKSTGQTSFKNVSQSGDYIIVLS